MSSGERNATHLHELDSLRGLMAFWVFATHVMFIGGVPGHGLLGILRDGSYAVTVFIMLSGFAIALSLIRGGFAYGPYIARRLARLYPIYLVGLAAGAATFAVYPPLLQELGWAEPKDVARLALRAADQSTHRWPHLLAHLALLHGAIPDRLLYGSALSFNGAAWSLSLEMQFYLVAPFLTALMMNVQHRLLGLAAVVGVMLLGLVFAPFFPQVPSFLPMRLGYFVVGILTAIYLRPLSERPERLLSAVTAAVAIAVLSGSTNVFLPVIIFAGVLVAASISHPLLAPIRALLNWRFLVARGEESYGFYILHSPMMIGVAYGLHRAAPELGRWPFVGALAVITWTLTTIAAALSYRFMETPINRWAKRRFGRTASYPTEIPEARAA